jgi:hypothetical protein
VVDEGDDTHVSHESGIGNCQQKQIHAGDNYIPKSLQLMFAREKVKGKGTSQEGEDPFRLAVARERCGNKEEGVPARENKKTPSVPRLKRGEGGEEKALWVWRGCRCRRRGVLRGYQGVQCAWVSRVRSCIRRARRWISKTCGERGEAAG